MSRDASRRTRAQHASSRKLTAFGTRTTAMGKHINLPTSGTQCIGAYLAEAEGKPKGGLVVIQEIFGVNAHIRTVADRFAAMGYTAVAPAFFDHLETGVEMDYTDQT